MKFNTLTFDANLPTTQQVNVPTNTDYKVGLKVKRNGEIQQLGPDEITIYTGEVNVIPPTEYDSAAKNCSESIESILYNLDTTTATELSGQTVKATGVYIEISEDNGVTWQKKDPSGNVNLRVSDRSTGSNVYLYRTNLKNADRVWEIFDTDGSTVIGTTDSIVVPQIGRFGTGSMLPTLFGEFTYPIQFRLVVNYGGGVERITIPTDADKTNGYVTFTQASNDDASFRQLSVVVDTRVPGNKKVVDYIAQMTDNTVPRALSASVDEEGLVGQYYGEDGQLEFYLWNDSSQPPADYTQWTKQSPAGSGTKVVKCSDGSLWYWRNLPEPSVIGEKTYDAGYWFLHTNPAGTTFVEGAKSVLLQTGDYLITGSYRYTANNWLGIVTCVNIPPTGFTANFKLNVNEFKSQCGDLNVQTDPDFNTAKVEGTYADGTEFSYDFCIK